MPSYHAPKYIELTPKTEQAKTKLGCHGTRWTYRETVQNCKYQRTPGPHLVCRSRDGSAIIFISEKSDPTSITSCFEMARYPSGKGLVCKTSMRGFNSHSRL
jgi:hypothetical protein